MGGVMVHKNFYLFFCLLFFGSFCFAQDSAMPVISEVVIQGNKLVNTGLITKQLKTQKGKVFSRIDVDEDIKRLNTLNYFSKINVSVDEEHEFKVIFQLVEKPAVDRISFQGNFKIKTKKLRKELTLKEGELLNESKVSADVVKMKEMYEKKNYRQIDIQTEIVNKEAAGESGLVDVIFKINEGKKIRIKKIHIFGASQIKEKKVLKILKTKKKRWYNSGRFEKSQFQDDLDRIKAFYYQKGYIDIKIVNVRESYLGDGSKMLIEIEIREGHLYNVGTIHVEGNKNFETDVLFESTKLIPGASYLPENLNKDMKTIRDRYFKEGYIDVQVDVDTVISGEAEDVLNFKYKLVENDVVFVDKIRIVGNGITKDVVIRRELNITPGQRYDGVEMETAQKRLTNLGIFKNEPDHTVQVYADTETTGLNRDLIVRVEEDRTGELSFGAGFSSIDNLTGFLELSQGNFDLFNPPSFTGDVQKLKLRSTFGSRIQEFTLDFVEPWFLDRRLLFGTQLFTRSRTFARSDYSEDRKGFSVRLAKPIFKVSRGELTYSLENVEVKNVSDTASQFLRSQEGDRDVSKVGFTLTRDVRDNFFEATQGSKIRTRFEVAGLGGDVEYYSIVFDPDLYFNPWLDHVLIASLQVGDIEPFGDSEEVPIFDRFFLGGARSIRGFDFRDIGPHDAFEESLGGTFLYYGTFEYVVPIVEKFKSATFIDYGNLWEDFENVDFNEINVSYGLGLRISLPIGPLRFDYAWPIVTDDFHEGDVGHGKFTFDIGHRF
jgi:outer membrane protein insertion porin family